MSDNTREKSAGRNAGRLFIVSAPSGAGKTTLCDAVRGHFGDLNYSVSYTTRARRMGERHAVDYFFVTKEEFELGIREKRWAEWAKVHGNYYGTDAHWIQQSLASGQNILLDIDVQGMQQLVEKFPEAVTIFINPPSIEELRRRLEHRGLDDAQTIALRIENAQVEMDQQGLYLHIVVNDDLAGATQKLLSIFKRYLSP